MKKAALPKVRPVETKEPEAKSKAIGLCSSCIAFKDCTYPKAPDRPILECEEFDGEQASIRMRPQKINPNKKSVGASMNAAAGIGGLCDLCENLTTCTYPKPEGGVWHCEEYR